MNPTLRTLLWAVGGLVIAAALSLGAFAVAGGRISQPAGTVRLSHEHEGSEDSPSARPTPEPAEGPDDHGGSTSHPTGELDPTSTSSAAPTHSGSGHSSSSSSSSGSHSPSPSGSGSEHEHEGGDD
jgi:hypothetical protein